MQDAAPTQELLTFPTQFPIKVMGLAHPEFPHIIGSAVREICPDFQPDSVTVSYSRNRKYMALGITVNAVSKEQLDTLYQMLTSHPSVKVAL